MTDSQPRKSSNSPPREDLNFQKTKKRIASSSWTTTMHKLSIMSMVWNISVGQLDYLCPS